MDRDALIHRLAETIAGDSGCCSMAGRISSDQPLGDGSLDMNGFCYTAEGDAVPVSPRDFAIFDVLEELRAAMAKTDGKTLGCRALSHRAQDRQVRHGIRIRAAGALGHNAHEREARAQESRRPELGAMESHAR